MIPQKKQNTEREIILGEDVYVHRKPVVEKIDYKQTIEDIGTFTQSSSMNSMIDEMKIKGKVEKYEETFVKILSTIVNIDDKDKLENVFKTVLQSIEDYIYCKDKDKCNKMKHDLAIRLLKQFVKNDEGVCEQIIKMSLKTIKKSTLWRRNKKRCMKLLFFLSKMLQRVI